MFLDHSVAYDAVTYAEVLQTCDVFVLGYIQPGVYSVDHPEDAFVPELHLDQFGHIRPEEVFLEDLLHGVHALYIPRVGQVGVSAKKVLEDVGGHVVPYLEVPHE